MPYATGDRVRLRRPDPRTRARRGDFASVVSTDRTWDDRHMVRVRLERDFSRTQLQTRNGYDYSLTENQVEPAPAATAETSDSSHTFAVGDRVRLRNGARTLESIYVSDPVGTEGTIAEVYGSGAFSVRTEPRGSRWSVHEDMMELIPPAPTFTVGQRVRLRDGARTLQNHYITDPAGTEGTINRLDPGWDTDSDGNSIIVRTERNSWYVFRDQIEPVPADAVQENMNDPRPTVQVGDRIVCLRANGIPEATGQAGEVIRVPDRRNSIQVRFDAAVAGEREWNVHEWRREEPTPAPAWAVGMRVRRSTETHYSDDQSSFDYGTRESRVGDLGEITSVSDDYLGVRWDRTGGSSAISRRNVEPVETPTGPDWRRLNSVGDADVIGRQVRYSMAGSTSGQLQTGDTGRVVFRRTGGSYCVLMDDPRGKSTSTFATGGVAYHWTTPGSDFEVDMGETPAAPAQTYEVTYGRQTTTWTVGETLMWGDREVRVIPLGSVESARGGGWVEVHVVAENRDTGITPTALTRPAAATPPVTETPRDAAGEVTFTDEQKRAIARIAQRYGESHGFEQMAREIVTALGADPNQGNRRRTRLTFFVDVELEGNDYTLPASANDLRSMIRTSQANALVDAVLNRRLRRVGDATMGDRGITYRD